MLTVLKGEGVLRPSAEDSISVTYELTISRSATSARADGHLSGDPIKIMTAMLAGRQTLTLANGSVVRVILTRAAGNTAQFSVDGPVPGY